MKLSVLLAGLVFGLAPVPVLGQDVIAPGFFRAGTQQLPAAFCAYHTLSSGERVVFDGTSVDLYDADGGFLLHLGDAPSFVFASFVEADPSETFALVGESLNGDVFKVFLDGSGMSTLTNLFFNYDALFEDATHALVSAATCGFGCGNDIVRVDASSGATTLVAHVPGPSGPVAMMLDGSLLVEIPFPRLRNFFVLDSGSPLGWQLVTPVPVAQLDLEAVLAVTIQDDTGLRSSDQISLSY